MPAAAYPQVRGFKDLGTQKKRRARETEPLGMEGGTGGCRPPRPGGLGGWKPPRKSGGSGGRQPPSKNIFVGAKIKNPRPNF